MTTRTIKFIAVAAILTATAAVAQEPVQNVSTWKHGNIAAAQQYTRMAFDKMTAAQQANEFDLGGHAGRAKQLLDQAASEMKLAALAANHR